MSSTEDINILILEKLALMEQNFEGLYNATMSGAEYAVKSTEAILKNQNDCTIMILKKLEEMNSENLKNQKHMNDNNSSGIAEIINNQKMIDKNMEYFFDELGKLIVSVDCCKFSHT